MKYSLFSAQKRATGERALIPEQARGDEEYPEAAQSSHLCTIFRKVRAQLHFDGTFSVQHEPYGDENLLCLPCFAQSQESFASFPWALCIAARVLRLSDHPSPGRPRRQSHNISLSRSALLFLVYPAPPGPEPPPLAALCFCWLARLRVGHPLFFRDRSPMKTMKMKIL